MYRIRDLGLITGPSPQTIRYYERIGVLPDARRSGYGYRVYDDADVSRLNYILRARQLDFPQSKIAEILAFRDQEEPPCDHVKDMIESKLNEVEDRVRELEHLPELTPRQPISNLLRQCAP